MNQLRTEKQIAEHFGFPKSLVRKLRVEGKIPYLCLGYRSLWYSLPEVTAAMKRLEVQEVR